MIKTREKVGSNDELENSSYFRYVLRFSPNRHCMVLRSKRIVDKYIGKDYCYG